MNVTETFRAALLLYIQFNVDPEAFQILNYGHGHGRNCDGAEGAGDHCDGDTRVRVRYQLREMKDGSLTRIWVYDGDMIDLIVRLDADVLN